MSEKVVIGNATLYRGDCLEILPTLADWVEDWLQTMSADEETILNLRAIEQALRTAANWQSQCALNLHKLKYTEAERDALQARIDAAPEPINSYICTTSGNAKADAALIVAMRNSYDALLAIRNATLDYRQLHDQYGDDSIQAGRAWVIQRRALDKYDRALADLEGEK